MDPRDIIVIGASAGGLEAIQRLVATLPVNLPASIFVTLHYGGSRGILADMLNRARTLPAAIAEDDAPIEKGKIYVAPPDFHLLVGRGKIQLSHGPRENLQRPCINVMFRSAAASYGPRVIGVLLTGLLDDGAAGLWEIQQLGGATVVQDPSEAAYPSMPENAIRGLNVQYIVRLDEMGPLLKRLTMNHEQRNSSTLLPPQIEPAGQTCPECGGVMTLTRMGALREYRCHTGHRFGQQTMLVQKSSLVEHALGVALSQSEELATLLESSLAAAAPEEVAQLCEEIAALRREQETLRSLNRSRRSPETLQWDPGQPAKINGENATADTAEPKAPR